MTTLRIPTIELIEQNPEVKAFIYQQLSEFEPFLTPETIVSVVAKDPLKLALQYETEGKEFDKRKMKKQHRIAIVLNNSGTTVEGEGVHKDIYQAIKLAKVSLLKHLQEIQDTVISQKDRLSAINHYLQLPIVH